MFNVAPPNTPAIFGGVLTPGDRIEIKKRIADTLGQQSWQDIDLTLGEFGFPTEDRWDGNDAHYYVLEMLRSSSADGALAELDAYLHPRAEPEALPQPETFDDPANPWTGRGLRLFITHVTDYATQAGALRAELARRSIDAFVAHDSIEPTEEWQNVILYALRSCDACLALLTPGFQESDWTDQEVGFCMARKRLIIPLDHGLTPYGFLGKYQALPMKAGQTVPDVSLSVFELLVRKPESRDAMARALVTRWADSGSFDNARENYGFLKKIPQEAWTQQLVTQVWEAREQNYELREAWIGPWHSDAALEQLFADLPFNRPASSVPSGRDDDVPF